VQGNSESIVKPRTIVLWFILFTGWKDLMKRIIIVMIALSLSACVSAEEREQRVQEGAAAAQHFRADVEGEACISSFKQGMNDPDSFQLAGPLTYDEPLTVSVQGMGQYKKTVDFDAPIRGKNAMGGVVLKRMVCVFGINSDGSLSLSTTFETG
jgi:hypothetical protein